MENAFVLLIIFVILALAFIFVIAMQRSSQREKIAEFNEIELIKRSQILNFLPEMQCSDNNNLEPDCYDIYKIQAFKDKLESDTAYYNYYKTLLGTIKIDIKKYNPSPNRNEWSDTIHLYDNKPADYEGIKIVRFPVLLKDKPLDTDGFGIIELGVYE